jgi:hypothetical protein
MPVGDCQREFADAAAADGIALSRQSFDWLSKQGHFGLLREAKSAGAHDLGRVDDAVRVLEAIYLELGGDLATLEAGRRNKLRGDFLHEPTRTLIEIDESQHFTSFRLASLALYPENAPIGFDLEEYIQLCRRWRRKSDGYRRTKEARGFGPGGRQRQRPYYDALRDLATPAMGYSPLVRIDATQGNGKAAYAKYRGRLVTLLS